MDAPRSVLVYVGLDLMGDALMKLPFARALRHACPEAEILWLAGKGRTAFAGRLAPLTAGLFDEVVDAAGIGTSMGELWAPRPLGGRQFDLVIDTQRRLLTTLILRRIPHRRFISGCAGFWFSDAKPPAGYKRPPAMLAQMLDLLSLAVAGRLGAPLDTGGTVAVPEAVTAAAQRLLPDGPRRIALAPGAGERAKCWPIDRYVALGRELTAKGFAPVVLLGPADADLEPALRAGMPDAGFPLAQASDADLAHEPLLSMALARRCEAAVASDSGSGHILAASGVPLISLFGPTDPGKFAPSAERLRLVRAQDFGADAMDAIPVDAVLGAVEALLGGGGAR